MDDWLAELSKIRDQASRADKEREQTRDLTVVKQVRQAADLIIIVDAQNALRQVNAVLLNNQGIIHFQLSDVYDNAIALLWQGSLAQPRRPDENDRSALFGILVGVKGKNVFVNDIKLQFNTAKDLKAALVQAAKQLET